MDILSLQFASALAAIIVIDLMLAGDNAIVIALAARNVPAHLQKRAILWGTVGAIAVRSVMTLAVVWLLQVPGLLFAGGAVLVWIAYKLLLPDDSHSGGHDPAPTTSFWGAMRTIVIADAVMGLDNVLAVAGAAHGSYTLVVLGLLISVPIVVWGSSLLLKWVERYPVIVYFGAGVLAWTAVKMMMSEPYVKDVFAADEPYLVAFIYLAVIVGVLLLGFVHNHRRLESRISARLAMFSSRPEPSHSITPEKRDPTMKTVLLPVGDSRNAQFAVRRVVQEYLEHPGMFVHLLNVQMPLSQHIAQFLRQKTRDEYHRDRAQAALRPAVELLSQHKIPFERHVRSGDRATIIAREAERLKCDHIVMATARKNSLTRMLEDSTTNRVLELTNVPVELVAGDAVSKLERFGVPAGIAAALGLLVAAAFD
ncbi:MAG TPA: YjbE family putative metal transport protein [Usitatibacter sp.]|nr:YjbE family putative metal transport protein [Usitatibacter sp.]